MREGKKKKKKKNWDQLAGERECVGPKNFDVQNFGTSKFFDVPKF
jgi:hypothetical protein